MSLVGRLVRGFRKAAFRRQLTIVASVGVLCVSLLAALITSWQGSRQIRHNQLQQGERIAQNLAAQSRLALIFGSTENVEEAVAATLSFPDVTRIEIHHADGRLLLQRGAGPDDISPPRPLPAGTAARLESEDASAWRFVAPVLAKPGSDSPFEMTDSEEVGLGYVRIFQSKATLTRLMQEVFLVNCATGLLFSMLFLLALRLLARRLTQPLTDLSDTMARAEGGETGLRAKLAGPRDLADMAHAFNSMMQALEERESELRTARDSALRFAKLKADFAATVSHEIRTPLNGVIGTLDMLKTTRMSPDQCQLLELAWDSSQYLLELINNILDFSRLEAGRMEAEKIAFELQPLIDGVVNIFHSQVAGKGLQLSARLEPGLPAWLIGDPARIRQVLVNLVGNAVKFTESGSVALTVAPEASGRMVFSVTDTGIGIAPADRLSIFDSFTQADTSTTRRFGGSGLGLAICKQLVQVMGGEIGVDSTPGEGSRFWFAIPCLAATASLETAVPEGGCASNRGHILIVEDNRTNQVVAAGMLRLLGCTSGVAANGREAVAAWRQGGWDLILMDCNMPEMDGYQATAAIRGGEAEDGGRIPIVAMTANAQPVDIEKCLAAGMDDHLTKPLTLRAVALKLQRWLGWREIPSPDAGAPEPEAEAGQQPLDSSVLLRLREALGSGLAEAIRPFLEDMPAYLVELDAAVAAGNATALRQVAHVIKGAAGNLGASAVASVAKEIELHAEAGALVETGELLARLRSEFAQLEPALSAHLSAEQTSLPKEREDAPLVLIVDDDRSTRAALRHALRRSGFRAAEANNGRAALAWLESNSADAILMDALMPEMDGFTTCAALKRHPLWHDIPVLMITALEDRNSIERAFDAGASDFIPKPIHLSVVNQRVRRVIDAIRAERHVRQLAYNDTLTGLPNRVLFLDRLNRAIERTGAHNGMLAVLFLDLDRFKYVNDTLGHEVGDCLLAAMAQRIKGCVRTDDCVARLGGDEFTVLLEDLPHPGVAASVAQNICRTVAAPLKIEQQEIFINASIGISLYPADGEDVSSLLRHADTAMYRAKQSGTGFCFYEAAMELAIAERLQLENALRRALEQDEIRVFYQPVLDAASQTISSVEALVRWIHPTRGIVSPADFIPLAEENGLILPLGERVLRTACFQAKAWLDAGAPLQRVAVNLSAKQLEHDDLEKIVVGALKDSGLPPQALVLEITESVLMQQARAPAGILQNLRQLGVQVSIDDFGTGYSSLSYLKHLPADYLKIDRSFIQDMPEDADAVAIVTGIMALAHSLRLMVVAEGVETPAQRDRLIALGCDYLQGYLYAKPLPAEVIETQLLKGQRRPRAGKSVP